MLLPSLFSQKCLSAASPAAAPAQSNNFVRILYENNSVIKHKHNEHAFISKVLHWVPLQAQGRRMFCSQVPAPHSRTAEMLAAQTSRVNPSRTPSSPGPKLHRAPLPARPGRVNEGDTSWMWNVLPRSSPSPSAPAVSRPAHPSCCRGISEASLAVHCVSSPHSNLQASPRPPEQNLHARFVRQRRPQDSTQ